MKKNTSKKSLGDPFPNPTIIEALCELHFTSSDNASPESWDGKWFGRLLTELGAKYDMEPKVGEKIQIQSSSGQTKVSRQSVPMEHMIYRSKDGSHLFQLTPWKLTINEIKYERWDNFFDHIRHGWNCLSTIINSVGFVRIGMRYINKIPRKSEEETVGSWISDNQLIPKKILDQKKNFFYRSELEEKTDTKLILTIAEDISSKPSPSSLIFDIDVVAIKKFKPSWDSLSIEINDIHDEIRKVFDNSRTEKYTNYLNSIN